MPGSIIALIDVFVEIPDWRDRRGRRYSIAAILALAVAAMLCGYRSYSAIAEWGRNYGQIPTRQLGFQTGRMPCAATLHIVFHKLDVILIGGGPPPGRFLGWEERGELLPLLIRQVSSVHTTEFTQPDAFCKHALIARPPAGAWPLK